MTDPADPPTAVLAGLLPSLGLSGRVLVAGDPTGAVTRAAAQAGCEPVRWERRAGAGVPALPWPPPGPFDAATLRLPTSKPELLMSLHAVASVLRPGGRLLLAGANDEGIRSAGTVLAPVFGASATVEAKRHSRVLSAVRPAEAAGLKPDLSAWREEAEAGGDPPLRLASYPGVFARGRLDPGTALLLANLPALKGGDRALDFGCGTGVVAAAILAAQPQAAVDMLDADAVALVAARENAPGGSPILAAGIGEAGTGYRLIASNPPIHRGKAEDLSVLEALLAEGPRRLTRSGEMRIVVQKRVPVDRMRKGAEAVSADPLYRVWRIAAR
jgi:16S rRNA (guanine1207-N2)-methyltransferase